MTLYRKYRPQNFADIVGQEHIKQTLQNAVERDLVSHAYLFTGPRGTGKTSTARILAKVLNCDHVKDNNPCNDCDSCKQITAGNLIDIVEIDAASNRGIDEIRELKQTLQFQPSFVKNKIYIIDEVHMLTKEAFNALLKTLEEPPDYVYFVLATTEVDKIPDTIISRCQRFDFRRITADNIAERLVHISDSEKMKSEEAALKLIADAAEGGMRDAISLLEQLNSLYENLTENSVSLFLGRTEQKLCTQYIDQILSGDLNGAMESVAEIMSAGHHLEQIYKDVLGLLRKRFLQAVAEQEDPQIYLQMVQKLEQNYELFHKSAIPQLVFEVTAAQLVDTADFTPVAKPEPIAKVEPKKKEEPKEEEKRAPRDLKETKSKPEPKPAPEVAEDPVSVRDFKRGWSKVVDKLPNSKLRLTVKQGHIISFDGEKVHIAFNSQFHLSQVDKPEYIAEIEDTLKLVFDKAIAVELSDKTVAIPKVKKPKTEDMVETAMDIFEGL